MPGEKLGPKTKSLGSLDYWPLPSPRFPQSPTAEVPEFKNLVEPSFDSQSHGQHSQQACSLLAVAVDVADPIPFHSFCRVCRPTARRV